MYDRESLSDLHRRCHASLARLIEHCGCLSAEDFHREIEGFGYPTVQLQLHHEISAEQYWVGVLEGRLDIDETEDLYPTTASLETYRQEIFALTESYLDHASENDLNEPRPMTTWRQERVMLVPARVILRTQTHLFHHQGQILAMCRLLGKPMNGLDFPVD